MISTFVAMVVGRSIVRPIESITDVMQRLSAGETNVEIGYRDRRDEIGRMVDAIDIFRKNMIERHAMEQTLTEADRGDIGSDSRFTMRQDQASSLAILRYKRNVFIRLRATDGMTAHRSRRS